MRLQHLHDIHSVIAARETAFGGAPIGLQQGYLYDSLFLDSQYV